MPSNALYVGRGSKCGNPFTLKVAGSRENAVEAYSRWLNEQLFYGRLNLEELRGKDLACWCSLNVSCHADVLIEVYRLRLSWRQEHDERL